MEAQLTPPLQLEALDAPVRSQFRGAGASLACALVYPIVAGALVIPENQSRSPKAFTSTINLFALSNAPDSSHR